MEGNKHPLRQRRGRKKRGGMLVLTTKTKGVLPIRRIITSPSFCTSLLHVALLIIQHHAMMFITTLLLFQSFVCLLADDENQVIATTGALGTTARRTTTNKNMNGSDNYNDNILAAAAFGIGNGDGINDDDDDDDELHVVDSTTTTSSPTQQEQEQTSTTTITRERTSNTHNARDIRISRRRNEKQICSLSGGLDKLRLASSATRLAFRGALEDVEFIRQYVAESAYNNNYYYYYYGKNDNDDGSEQQQHHQQQQVVIGMTLDELSQTYDIERRRQSQQGQGQAPATTVEAGMGYVDDRFDRRIERYVSQFNNQPYVGTKQTDLSFIEPTANIFPSIVDRTSATTTIMNSATNGASIGTAITSMNQNPDQYPQQQQSSSSSSSSLYVAAWIGTKGEAWMYYPPLQKASTTNGTTVIEPFNFGEVLGPHYNSEQEEFVEPNLPPKYIERAYFTSPYPDTAIPGLSLITAQAPIYYTGNYMNYTYPNNTYIASTGIDISVDRMSYWILHNLDEIVTPNSLSMVVGVPDFHIILIQQTTVRKIYPVRTGMEEERVVRDTKNSSIIINDRRNQTYQVSDTIFQSPMHLTNADWYELHNNIKSLQRGERSYISQFNITLTNDTIPTTYYVMYERWPDVADWALLLFVPQEELDNSIRIEVEPHHDDTVITKMNDNSNYDNIIEIMDLYDDDDHIGHEDGDVHLHVPYGTTIETETVIHNTGTLDVRVTINKLPPWFTYIHNDNNSAITSHDDSIIDGNNDTNTIPAGTSRTFRFFASADNVQSAATSLIAFTIQDDGYDECFYEQVLIRNVYIKILYPIEMNQLDRIRPYGLTLSAVTVISAIGWSIWVFMNSSHRVVRASQPVFLHMMCGGIIVMGLSIIPLSVDDSMTDTRGCDIACMAFPWLFAMGFAIVFSALYSKIKRLNLIVAASKNYRRVYVSTRDVMIPFFVISTLNVTILSLWTGIAPLTWNRKTYSSSDGVRGDTYSYGYCRPHDNTFAYVCLTLLLLVNFAALVLALIQLYRARQLSTEYSEGKYIAIAVASMLQVFLTGLPILMIVTDSPQASYFITSTIVFVVAMSLLLLTFVPKFFIAGANPQPPNSTGHNSESKGTKGKANQASQPSGSGGISRNNPLPSGSNTASGQRLSTDPAEGQFYQRYQMYSSDQFQQRYGYSQPFNSLRGSVRQSAISDLSLSITMSEYEVLEQIAEEPEERYSCTLKSSNSPRMPTRHPTEVIDDVTDHNTDETGMAVLDDIEENRSTVSPPRQALRVPAEVTDNSHASVSENADQDSSFEDEAMAPAVESEKRFHSDKNYQSNSSHLQYRVPSTGDEQPDTQRNSSCSCSNVTPAAPISSSIEAEA